VRRCKAVDSTHTRGVCLQDRPVRPASQQLCRNSVATAVSQQRRNSCVATASQQPSTLRPRVSERTVTARRHSGTPTSSETRKRSSAQPSDSALLRHARAQGEKPGRETRPRTQTLVLERFSLSGFSPLQTSVLERLGQGRRTSQRSAPRPARACIWAGWPGQVTKGGLS
jgi:hypothetical protein